MEASGPTRCVDRLLAGSHKCWLDGSITGGHLVLRHAPQITDPMGRTKYRLMLGGLKSYLPFEWDYTGTGGTTRAEYCYSIWLRHLTLVHECGLPTDPATLVELGPGDSVGVGLAALLSGTTTYRALDVVAHANADLNLRILDELAGLFEKRAPIPGPTVFPHVHPQISSYDFPHEIMSDARIQRGLADENVASVRDATRALADAELSHERMRYVVPWNDVSAASPDSADMVLSQVVLQDVADLESVFRSMYSWLKPGGVMSHMIDFAGAIKDVPWNEHWTYSDWEWRLIRGNRPYYLNGLPLSAYLREFESHGFDVLKVTRVAGAGGVSRGALADRYRQVTDEDLATRGAHVVAVKR